MTTRDSYQSTIAAAELTKASTIYAAEQTRQLAADPVAGSKAKLVSIFQAEQVKQASHAVARDTLRNADSRDRDSF
jgi:hypothetical protein